MVGVSVRLLRSSLVCFAAVVIIGAYAGVASASSATLTASPSTGLADGQAISVHGTGYPANSEIEVIECHKVLGCDPTTTQYLGSSSTSFAVVYFTARVIMAGKTSVDCAKTSNCVLVAVNFPNPSAIAETPIRFDPTKPILPKLSISLSLDGTDGVVAASGVMVLHGNVTCNRAASVYIQADASQAQGGTISRGGNDTEMECTGAQTIPWQISINPENQFFVTGPAQASLYASAQTGRSYASDNTDGTVVLTPATLPTVTPSNARVTVPSAGTTVVLHYWIVLSAASQFPVTFDYSTLNGTASAPTDYTPASGEVTFPPGVTKVIVPITIQGNNESAGSRTFLVSVVDPTNATTGANHGRGTVTLVHS